MKTTVTRSAFAFGIVTLSTLAVPGDVLYLGNLFDDSKPATLHEALVSDTYKAEADNADFGVLSVGTSNWGGFGSDTEIAPGIRFSFTDVGGSATAYSYFRILNDAANTDLGGICTEGSRFDVPDRKVEEGIGQHANQFVTFDLNEIRNKDFLIDRFLAKAGINDSAQERSSPDVQMLAILSQADPADQVMSVYVNGVEIDTLLVGDVHLLDNGDPDWPREDLQGIPPGVYAYFDMTIPSEADFLTLATTAGIADGSVDSDHGVWSGARLEGVIPVSADFDGDGDVDGDDFIRWQIGFGDFPNGGAQKSNGDFDNDGDVDGDDFLGWQAEFGGGGNGAVVAVPERSTLVMMALGSLAVAVIGRWHSSRASNPGRRDR